MKTILKVDVTIKTIDSLYKSKKIGEVKLGRLLLDSTICEKYYCSTLLSIYHTTYYNAHIKSIVRTCFGVVVPSSEI